MRRPHARGRGRAQSEGDAFGMPLADLLTTALGCMMLIFMVASMFMRDELALQTQLNEQETTGRMSAEERARRLELAKEQLTRDAERLARQVATLTSTLGEQQRAAAAAAAAAAGERRDLGAQLDALSAALAAAQGRIEAQGEAMADAINSLSPSSARPVDVMLVIDGTKSMQASLDAARDNIKTAIRALRIVSPQARVGVTVFRDKKERPDFRIEHKDLTDDEDSLRAFLGGIKAASTSRDKDRPEWMCGGLEHAIQRASWRKGAVRLIAVVSDAATQSPKAKRCVELAARFHKEGGAVHISSTLPDSYGERREVTREYDEVVLREHAAVAQAGGGSHIKKADESALLEVVLRAAFEQRLEGVKRLQMATEPSKAP
jgi:cell division protein FtsB